MSSSSALPAIHSENVNLEVSSNSQNELSQAIDEICLEVFSTPAVIAPENSLSDSDDSPLINLRALARKKL